MEKIHEAVNLCLTTGDISGIVHITQKYVVDVNDLYDNPDNSFDCDVFDSLCTAIFTSIAPVKNIIAIINLLFPYILEMFAEMEYRAVSNYGIYFEADIEIAAFNTKNIGIFKALADLKCCDSQILLKKLSTEYDSAMLVYEDSFIILISAKIDYLLDGMIPIHKSKSIDNYYLRKAFTNNSLIKMILPNVLVKIIAEYI